MGASFTKLRLFFHIVSIIINKLFPPLRETNYAGRVGLFAVQSVVGKTAASECMLHGAKNMKVGWCLIRSVGRKMMENSPAHCCSRLPCEQIGVQSSVYVPLTSYGLHTRLRMSLPRFNDANTKTRAWTRSERTSIHFKSSHRLLSSSYYA